MPDWAPRWYLRAESCLAGARPLPSAPLGLCSNFATNYLGVDTMSRTQYLIMKQALEDEYKKYLRMKDLEAAALVIQVLRAKCPEVRRHA